MKQTNVLRSVMKIEICMQTIRQALVFSFVLKELLQIFSQELVLQLVLKNILPEMILEGVSHSARRTHLQTNWFVFVLKDVLSIPFFMEIPYFRYVDPLA